MNRARTMRVAAVVVATVVGLSSCAGLPMSGPVENGLPVGADQAPPEFDQVASGPIIGAGPEEIVEGFLEAAITPNNGWSIAQEFLTPAFADRWRPSIGVTIDQTGSSRTFTSDIPDTDEAEEAAETGDVRVQLQQVAGVDETGVYGRAVGTSAMTFRMEKVDDQWRIAEAPDGIVLDEVGFSQVFEGYALQFWDQSWSRLVPDMRWMPRRKQGLATSITQALITGPSAWLQPAVRLFPGDVQLAKDAVVVDRDQVADVALNSAALGLDATSLSRIRTQLERTLAPLGVVQVQLTVDGQNLQAGTVSLGSSIDPSILAYTEDGFGTLVGGRIVPLPGISDTVEGMGQPLASADIAADGESAAVQQVSGAVFHVGDGQVTELDSRPGLVRPNLDPLGYTWTVQADGPHELIAWDANRIAHEIVGAWPEASSVSAIRISADGARLAALIMIGGEQHLSVASIVRDADGVPIEIGGMRDVAVLEHEGIGLAWIGSDTLAVLSGGDDPRLLEQEVAGPGTSMSVPVGSIMIAGATGIGAVRLLGDDGVVYARRGSTWQESAAGVMLLGTRAGY